MLDISEVLAAVRTHQIWRGMHSRCTNPKATGFNRYGGRGITVCLRWQKFDLFYADMGLAPNNRSLERVNNDGPYSPENCKWATHKEQSNNTNRSIKITFKGEALTLTQWAKKLDISQKTMMRRFNDGKSIEEVLGVIKIAPDIETARAAMLAMRRAVTHCKHGHEFTKENTLIFKSGTRHCKECARTRAREFYRKKAGVAR